MRKKQKKLIFLFVLILVVVFYSVRLNKSLDEYGETVLKNTVYTNVNKRINRYITERGDLFSSIVHHEYNNQGKLCALRLDGGKLGALQSGLEQEILKSIAEMEAAGFKVPIGNICGSKLFSGRGPHIKIQTVPLTTLACDTVNEFKSVGINHTIHSVGLEFTVSFKAAYPFGSTTFQTKFDVILCESIIIGEVPSVYFN